MQRSDCSHQPQHWNPLQFKWVKWVQSMSTDSFDMYPIHDVFICTADGSHWLDASVTTCFYRYDGNVMQVDVLPCSGRKKGKVDASQVLCLIPLVTWLSLYRSTNLWPNKTTFKLFRSYSSPPLLWMNFFSSCFFQTISWESGSLTRTSFETITQQQKAEAETVAVCR